MTQLQSTNQCNLASSYTEQLEHIPESKLIITVPWEFSYRIQLEEYNSQKSAPVFFSIPTIELRGRFNSPTDSYAIMYIAISPETAIAEVFNHINGFSRQPGAKKYFTDIDIRSRELTINKLSRQLRLIDCRKLLPYLGLTAEMLEGDDCYHITQPLADTLYKKFGRICDGLLYSSRVSGETKDCAALWTPEVVNKHELFIDPTQIRLDLLSINNTKVDDFLEAELGFTLMAD